MSATASTACFTSPTNPKIIFLLSRNKERKWMNLGPTFFEKNHYPHIFSTITFSDWLLDEKKIAWIFRRFPFDHHFNCCNSCKYFQTLILLWGRGSSFEKGASVSDFSLKKSFALYFPITVRNVIINTNIKSITSRSSSCRSTTTTELLNNW